MAILCPCTDVASHGYDIWRDIHNIRAGDDFIHEIQDALAAKGYTVERKSVRLAEPIKSLGVFEVPIHLYEEIEAPVKVWVVRK